MKFIDRFFGDNLITNCVTLNKSTVSNYIIHSYIVST